MVTYKSVEEMVTSKPFLSRLKRSVSHTDKANEEAGFAYVKDMENPVYRWGDVVLGSQNELDSLTRDIAEKYGETVTIFDLHTHPKSSTFMPSGTDLKSIKSIYGEETLSGIVSFEDKGSLDVLLYQNNGKSTDEGDIEQVYDSYGEEVVYRGEFNDKGYEILKGVPKLRVARLGYELKDNKYKLCSVDGLDRLTLWTGEPDYTSVDWQREISNAGDAADDNFDISNEYRPE
ncbi:MAG: hypothetical protein ACI83O_000231 [Patescibacteria group bacterium]|jgi:hypothetical protein